jgi:plasmid stabilization system protein ParE
MVEVRVTEKAYKDLEAIAEFIARDSEKYAKVLVQQFYSSILVLQNFPLSG